MPLINGQKMACEPCIRGHRSTKCTHADERLMVPVRKPGRPLSACPHAKNQSCGCGKVTAAIPRKQKCHCGTSGSSQPAATPVIKSETDDQANMARSPTRASSGSISGSSSHRVQKSVSKSTASRNPTIDTSKLERMDPSQFNVLSSPDATQQMTPTISASPMSQNIFAYGPMGMTAAGQSFAAQPMMFPMFPQPLASPVPSQHAINGDLNKQASMANGTGSGAPTGSCCGGGATRSTSSQPSTTPTTPGTDTAAGTEKKGSCCSNKTSDATNTMSQNGAPQSGISMPAHANGMMMPGFAPQMTMTPNGMYPFYAQPTIFTYPPQYGSFMQPLQPEQWRQFIANMNFAQSTATAHSHDTGFGMSASMGFPGPGSTTMGGGTSHQCGCGDGCQCVGCAAHPYNEATQNYVRSAWNSMMEEPRASANGQLRSLNGHGDFSHAGTGGASEVALMKDAINGVAPRAASSGESSEAAMMKDAINGIPPTATGGAMGLGDGTVSPPAPQTPSEAASGMSEEQTLSANDFFFVSYPFGDSCAGDTASCPCGDDCQCIGCVIHGNASADPAAL